MTGKSWLLFNSKGILLIDKNSTNCALQKFKQNSDDENKKAGKEKHTVDEKK